jgi:hypothetical protein
MSLAMTLDETVFVVVSCDRRVGRRTDSSAEICRRSVGHFLAVMYSGTGTPVTFAYSTSESRSASFGQHTVPSSELTSTCVKTVVESDAESIFGKRLYGNDVSQHGVTPMERCASATVVAAQDSNRRAAPGSAWRPIPSDRAGGDSISPFEPNSAA